MRKLILSGGAAVVRDMTAEEIAAIPQMADAPPAEKMPDVRDLAREVAALRLEVDALVKVAVRT
jgi:hypothetical protein